LSAVVFLLILRVQMRKYGAVFRRRQCEYLMSMILGCLGRYLMIFFIMPIVVSILATS
jgi:hypothetical protein